MKTKIVPNYKQKKIQAQTPQDMEAYWKAFNAGRDYERKVAIQYFISRIEDLKKVEGIGEHRFQKIIDFVNKEWNQ